MINLADLAPPDRELEHAWRRAWREPPAPRALWLVHPSAQNMSPYAGTHTAFHARMREAHDVLRMAVQKTSRLDTAGAARGATRDGNLALPERKELVQPRNELLDALWREKGI